MKKSLHIIIKIVFSLLILSPILGAFGIFPSPTADMYNTQQAFDFINVLTVGGYINIIMAIVHTLALFFIWTKREALASILELPIVVNIIGFHAFLDGGLLTMGALMGDILMIIVLYFIWKNKEVYRFLFQKRN